eukprot:tig00001024_g6330.t1
MRRAGSFANKYAYAPAAAQKFQKRSFYCMADSSSRSEAEVFGQEPASGRELSALEKFLVFHEGSESTHLPDGFGWGCPETTLMEHLETTSEAASRPTLSRLEDFLFSSSDDGMFPDGLSVPGLDPADFAADFQ